MKEESKGKVDIDSPLADKLRDAIGNHLQDWDKEAGFRKQLESLVAIVIETIDEVEPGKTAELYAHFAPEVNRAGVIRFDRPGGGFVDVPVGAILEEFVELPAAEAPIFEMLGEIADHKFASAPDAMMRHRETAEALEMSPQGDAAEPKPNPFDEFAALLNRNGDEVASVTPDFLLAKFLRGCLSALEVCINDRDKFYEFEPREMTLRGVNIGGRGPEARLAWASWSDEAAVAVGMDLAEPDPQEGAGPAEYPPHPRAEFWDAVNEYARACGGDTSEKTVGIGRANAVAKVDREVARTIANVEMRRTGQDEKPIAGTAGDQAGPAKPSSWVVWWKSSRGFRKTDPMPRSKAEETHSKLSLNSSMKHWLLPEGKLPPGYAAEDPQAASQGETPEVLDTGGTIAAERILADKPAGERFAGISSKELAEELERRGLALSALGRDIVADTRGGYGNLWKLIQDYATVCGGTVAFEPNPGGQRRAVAIAAIKNKIDELIRGVNQGPAEVARECERCGFVSGQGIGDTAEQLSRGYSIPKGEPEFSGIIASFRPATSPNAIIRFEREGGRDSICIRIADIQAWHNHFTNGAIGSGLPTAQERPNGLHQRYRVSRMRGPTDPNAVYFVLRLDNAGKDPVNVDAARCAAMVWAAKVKGTHLEQVGNDLEELIRNFEILPLSWVSASTSPMVWSANARRMISTQSENGNRPAFWIISIRSDGRFITELGTGPVTCESEFPDRPNFETLRDAKDYCQEQELAFRAKSARPVGVATGGGQVVEAGQIMTTNAAGKFVPILESQEVQTETGVWTVYKRGSNMLIADHAGRCRCQANGFLTLGALFVARLSESELDLPRNANEAMKETTRRFLTE